MTHRMQQREVRPADNLARRVGAALAAGALFVAVAAAAAPAAAFSVTGLQAHAEPASYTGACPATITFVGEITADGPGTVVYRWEHSPGTGTPKTVVFDAAGTRTVSYAATLAGPDFLALVTDSPNEVFGPLVSVEVHCQVPGTQKTDLALTNFVLLSKGACKAGETAFTLSVTVKNIGKVDYPYLSQSARLIARDTSLPSWFGIGGLVPAIKAGGSVNVAIPVPYQEAAVNAPAPHPFRAQVDDLGNVDELNENNNLSANTVALDIKGLCAKIGPKYKKKFEPPPRTRIPVKAPSPPEPDPVKQQLR
jgi:hypothetical protein